MSIETASKLVRCPECAGRKKVIGLGNMEKSCSNCNAIGWVTESSSNDQNISSSSSDQVDSVMPKKRGRKKKEVA